MAGSVLSILIHISMMISRSPARAGLGDDHCDAIQILINAPSWTIPQYPRPSIKASFRCQVGFQVIREKLSRVSQI